MRNLLPIFLLLLCGTLILKAQGAKKYVLFEHFTNASCPPCATQNPIFDALYSQNETRAHHVAYHTSWPGFDPMYQLNTSEPSNRVSYYGVGGVPDMLTNGLDSKQPGSVTQADIDGVTSQTSPIGVNVTQELLSDTEGKAEILVTTHGDVPNGNWVIRVAVVEKYIDYGSAPGSNGESAFPNVFRKMISGVSGESFTAAEIGGSARFSYDFEIDSEWNKDQIYVLAFVQNNSTKEVLNSGSSIDIPVRFTLPLTEFTVLKKANEGESVSFAGSMETLFKSSSTLQFSLTTDAPEDWSASMLIGDLDLPIDYAQLPYGGGEITNLGIKVTAGTTKAVARYDLTVTLADSPLTHPLTLTYYVNSGAKNVVVDNSTNPAWGVNFTDGIAYSEGEAYGRISKKAFIDGVTFQAMPDLENIYFNVGWTFPSLTDDFLFMLINQMDRGANLLIMGQDIGWEIESSDSPYGSPLARSFFKNYLHADFVDDGNNANSSLGIEEADEDFGHLSTTSIFDYYGGSFYPDQIRPDASSEVATPIFYYGNSTRIAGIKAHTENYKMVYVGVGLEMMNSEESRNEFMKATYDWFNGTTTDIEFDKAVGFAMSQNHPNPSSQLTSIDLKNITQDASLTLMDATGRKVMERTINAGTTQIELNTAHLQSGIYVYQLKSGSQVLATKKLVIAH